jgi:hypothetical protein
MSLFAANLSQQIGERSRPALSQLRIGQARKSCARDATFPINEIDPAGLIAAANRLGSSSTRSMRDWVADLQK